MREAKTAIITSGGGMKCAYAAGALVALFKKLNITEPDIFLSASGSVGAMFYYLSGQVDDIERIWLRYVPSANIVSLVPPKLNLDYVVDTILKQELPLDIEALKKTASKWIVPVTDLDTGQTLYINNDTWFDPYEVMRAAKAIPLLYGGAVRLGVHPYIDGGISANMADLVHQARKAGATKILIISNSTRPTLGTRMLLRGYSAVARPVIRELILKDINEKQWDHMPSDEEIIVISPSYPLPTGMLTRTRRKVAETYQMGHDDLIEHKPAIEKLFSIHETSN